MIKLNGISKQVTSRTLFDSVSFVVNAGECAGVIGPNGSGKTTLLRIIAGADRADAGSIEITEGLRLGYLRQGYAPDAGRSVNDVFPTAFRHLAAWAAVETLAARMTEEKDPQRAGAAADRYATALAALPSTADVAALHELWRTLSLRDIAPDERTGTLSGGEQTKLGLIDLVASAPDALLLDEPTNNLDLPALAWLGDYLDRFAGPVILVSHDRVLLDDHATQIVELDPGTRRAETFAGDYGAYAAEKARRNEAAWQAYRQQQRRDSRIAQEIRAIKATAQRRESTSQNDFYRRKAKKVARRAVVLERRLLREAAAPDRVEKPQGRTYRVKAAIETAQRGGDRMLAVEGLALEAGGRPLLHDISVAFGRGERAVLIGPNGSGKTTLLRALLGAHALSAGSVHTSPSTRIGYLPQAADADASARASGTPLSSVRDAAALSETEARRFLHRFLFSGDAVLTPVARLSYGERRRLALAALVLSGANLLLLDEPTNHLDIPSREAFEAALESYEGAILAVTHDRYFIERFGRRLLSIEDGSVREV